MKVQTALAVLVLAAFAVSCEQSAPTVPNDPAAYPADGPLFAKPNCEVDPTHPSCKDQDGDGDAAYAGIDLGTHTGGKKSESTASDLTDELSLAMPTVVGASWDLTVAYGPRAVVWEWSTDHYVIHELDSDFHYDKALGISDDGAWIVGRGSAEEVSRAVVFRGSPQTLDAAGDYAYGRANDVNNTRTIVGTSFDSESDGVATVWACPPDGCTPAPLPFTGDFDVAGATSEAFSLNNDGDIVGWMERPSSQNPDVRVEHPVLWRPTDLGYEACDLNIGDHHRSFAWGVTDRVDGTVLVAGASYSVAGVWTLNLPTTGCPVVTQSSFTPVGNPETGTQGFDVTGVGSDWELAGVDHQVDRGRPVVWTPAGQMTILDRSGRAYGINSSGQIVGHKKTKGISGPAHAVLWVPTAE